MKFYTSKRRRIIREKQEAYKAINLLEQNYNDLVEDGKFISNQVKNLYIKHFNIISTIREFQVKTKLSADIYNKTMIIIGMWV